MKTTKIIFISKRSNRKIERNQNRKLVYLMPKGQMLAFMQGIPGAGKTTIARKLADALGFAAVFSGTTGTAAAQLRADTINKLLGLGQNYPNFTDTEITFNQKQNILNAFENVDLLIIDEVSMLTPVTLSKINFYLQKAFENDYVFGGISVLLIGDMFQFPPIEQINNLALYQAAVQLAMVTVLKSFYQTGAKYLQNSVGTIQRTTRATPYSMSGYGSNPTLNI